MEQGILQVVEVVGGIIEESLLVWIFGLAEYSCLLGKKDGVKTTACWLLDPKDGISVEGG